MKIQNIEEYFPKNYSPRSNQVDILTQIQDAINSGVKFIILEGPTGSGKSMFSATLANYTPNPSKDWIKLVDEMKMFEKNVTGEYNYEYEAMKEPAFGTFVLTITKTLQNQYSKLFEDCSLLKGKSNYECNIDTDFDADLAPCMLSSKLYKQCQLNKTCDYLNRRDELVKSKFGVVNYSMFLSLPDHVKKRSIIVCDEASELEDELVDHFSATIEYSKLKYLGLSVNKLITEDIDKAFLWLTDITTKLDSYIKEKYNNLSKSQKVNNIGDMTKLRVAINLHERVLVVLENWKSCEYVLERDATKATFVPLYVDVLSNNIFKYADTVVLMSATIVDPKTFTKALGITDYKYIQADSMFDPKKAPIYCPGSYNLNYSNIDKNLPKVVDQALSICEHYQGKHGIIHTHSFKITESVKDRSRRDKRFLFREDGISNEQILQEHFAREDGTVLVSPSLGYGIDLMGKYGAFQVIIKLPYLPLGSKRIKILFEKNKDWYQMKMLINLIQMCGRIIRSEEDKGDTFILDGQAVDTLKRVWSKLPKHFRSRLK